MIDVPRAAIDLAKRFEGFCRVPKNEPGRAYPYICPAGYWTIGYGHLCDPKHPPITESEAEVYLMRDLQTALAATLRHCPVLAANPRDDLRLSSTSHSISGLGGFKHRLSAEESISAIGVQHPKSYNVGYMLEEWCCQV